MPGIVLALLAAALDLVATARGWYGTRPFTQPLAAFVLGVTALFTAGWQMRALGIGLLFAGIGDHVLLYPQDQAFLFGMLAFAAMHVCYIVAFQAMGTPTTRDRMTWSFAAFCLLAVGGANMLLDPFAGTFAIPLAVYSLLLATMAWSAFDLHNRVRSGAARVAIGGVLFMLSDTLLAFAKFYPVFWLKGQAAELFILATYFAAQLLIASGMLRANSATAS